MQMATKFYAWSEIRNGGEVEEITRPGGSKKAVVISRNIVKHGDEVKKSDFESADWDHLVDVGVIRPYPLPEGVDDTTSPSQVVLAQLYKGGEIDMDKLVELTLMGQIGVNPPASEGAELESPKGA
jgi:hypothetical protein